MPMAYSIEKQVPLLEHVLPDLKSALPEILVGRPVMLAYLHGSVVDKMALPSSDVDIALVFSPDSGLSLHTQMLVEADIAAEIERRCGIAEADVRSLDHAPLAIQGAVLTDGILLYSRDETFRVNFEVPVRKQYLDFMPTLEWLRKNFLQSVRLRGLAGGKIR